MEKEYKGIIDFEKEIICDFSCLGKNFLAKIGGIIVSIVFPQIEIDPAGIEKLISPFPNDFKKVDWGIINSSPNYVCRIKRAGCIISGSEDDIQSVYLSFSEWRNKLYLVQMVMSDSLIRDTPTIRMVRAPDSISDYYTGLEIYEVTQNRLRFIHSSQNSFDLSVDLISDNCVFNSETLLKMISLASDNNCISEVYLLLAEASKAYCSCDYRKTVILSACALEKAMVLKAIDYCQKHGMVFKPLGTLGSKFTWFQEHGIPISVQNYKTRILTIRNNVVHKGINVEPFVALGFRRDCRELIFEYAPSIVADNSQETYFFENQ